MYTEADLKTATAVERERDQLKTCINSVLVHYQYEPVHMLYAVPTGSLEKGLKLNQCRPLPVPLSTRFVSNAARPTEFILEASQQHLGNHLAFITQWVIFWSIEYYTL